MRLEFNLEIDKIETPRFSVEAVEGIGKMFTLATLVLNVLDTCKGVEIVFHGLNPEDPSRKIEGFKKIMESSPTAKPVSYSDGAAAQIPGSSSYFQWLSIHNTSR
ncbi:MAG: hypothetical protein JRJ58_24275 [Deltaproteobacteria bacterium]|nr:hypothetical protein [Deltaproteobacteria bacterium]